MPAKVLETDAIDSKQLLAVLTSVKKGDFSVRLPLDRTGIGGKIYDTLNDIIEMKAKFADELQRVSEVVGKEGRISQRASLGDVSGGWKVYIDSINSLITNLVQPTTEVSRVIRAVARGDLSQRMAQEIEGIPLKGEFAQTVKVVNAMVEQLNSFASEVTRVAREVGMDGKLGGQADVKGVAGTWKDLTESVNMMASNLTAQVRNIAEVTIAVANGDLSRKITVDVRGEFLQLKETMNTMVDQLNSFASEVTRVAREVGVEGKLGVQAEVRGVAGTWKDLTDNVNMMASNLTGQVRNIAEVTTAVANGDLSRKITVDVKGEILELKNTINVMVDQLNSFASEVTRVAREVGTEGKLGGQAEVRGVAGTWKDLTDSVNSMASNLTAQVRNIAEVTTAVANGDLSRKITVDVKGEILELKNTINTMVEQLSTFASEVTRVAREVGTEGKLGGQAEVRGVAGTWKDLTDSVNMMGSNLTAQVRNIAEVTTAVANGDLSRKITVDVKGEILELKNTINVMVDQLNSFASEVTRVAREVGTEGKLGGQAEVRGVAGTWKDLTDNVNMMASNLTGQMRNIAEVTIAVANGDLSRKITVDVRGEFLQLKETINTMVEQLRSFASEVTRVAREVGIEGKLGGQAYVPGVGGTWKDLTDSVNMMASNLTGQVRNIALVTTAVANGDLSRKITVDVKGEILELKNTINVMVDQLNSFASEVTRVAREVGSEGKLGGQAQVRGVGGTWKDLTDNVNMMASNLTNQVRGIAKVVTAVANGELNRKLTLEAKGEIATLAETINNMIDTLAIFADQVTSVAREVGVEGKLGGQAEVPGAAGTWKDLTDNVNRLAANLTTQVRAIAEVATAVTKGDLSRSIAVEAAGEVAALKDNINAMIRNLKDTTRINTEQDWLKTNLTRFTRLLQGQRDLLAVAQLILSELAPLVNVQHGVLYLNETDSIGPLFRLFASYGFKERKSISNHYRPREGLIGQCAFEKQRILLSDVPDDYIKISSGLGEASPLNIVVLPVVFETEILAIIELASFQRFNETHLAFLDQLTESIGIVLNTIAATNRTEELLKQSQTLALELQSQQQELTESNKRLEDQAQNLRASEERLKMQQDELQQTNEELEEKARLLALQNAAVERKNQEIDLARKALEEKATQLAVTSKYKSEFLANMSHELRTPLNSLLILSKVLSDNEQSNLSEKQVEFASTIHAAGSDLLSLINDILDLSKIEAGKVDIEWQAVKLQDLARSLERTFRPVADSRNNDFTIRLAANLPDQFYTDDKRIQQVLKNLISNAMKFTHQGDVIFEISQARSGWNSENESLNQASRVFAFAVQDTGIGIDLDKQKTIFEPFVQADGTTSRKYGGTGLGLSISREIAHLLGGEIVLTSAPGKGSTFTLYLPWVEAPAAPRPVRPAPAPVHHPPHQLPLRWSEPEAARGDQTVLIVEDDNHFARILQEVAQEKGFKSVLVNSGEEALEEVVKWQPAAILLDVFLPGIDGWTVLSRLQEDSRTRQIPIHILSVSDEAQRSLQEGAVLHLAKPVTKDQLVDLFVELEERTAREFKKLLIVHSDEAQRQQLMEQLSRAHLHVDAVESGAEALEALDDGLYDCVVLDVNLSDMTAIELIEKLRTEEELVDLPVLVYPSRELSSEESEHLGQISDSLLLQGNRSPERLQAEVALFLHDVNENQAPSGAGQRFRPKSEPDTSLVGRKVLIVDDDVRNIFALSSILEAQQMDVLTAENGRAGIDSLQEHPDVDIVLMDVMMPEMDGYETTAAIRRLPEFKSLPIIAITAKAMKGDREKCLEAGASDYITKPVDIEQLLSLMRVWLAQRV